MSDERDELTAADGEEPESSAESSTGEARMRILDMIDGGQISAEEGLRLLEAIQDEVEPAPAEIAGALPAQAWGTLPPEGEYVETPEYQSGGATYSAGRGADMPYTPPPLPPEVAKWRRWWMLPLGVGIVITAVTGAWMYLAMQNSAVFLFLSASLPFAIGVLIVILAWSTRNGPWLHLRIDQQKNEWPRKIAFSFPLPIGLTAWFLRRFGDRIPNLKQTNVDEIIQAIGKTTSPEKPIYIQVDEGDDGEKVEIYIG